MTAPSSPSREWTYALSTNRPGLRLAVKCAGGQRPGSAETGRPSAFHFSQPPSSTAAPSKPKARSIHQTRVAHMMLPAEYSTTRDSSPMPSAPIALAKCSDAGAMNLRRVSGSETAP